MVGELGLCAPTSLVLLLPAKGFTERLWSLFPQTGLGRWWSCIYTGIQGGASLPFPASATPSQLLIPAFGAPEGTKNDQNWKNTRPGRVEWKAGVDQWDSLKMQENVGGPHWNTTMEVIHQSQDFPGKDTGVGCHFLLQGIFLTQGTNPGFLHCRQILFFSFSHGLYCLNICNYYSIHKC